MISFLGVDKVYRSRDLTKVILDNVTIDLPDRNIALLGGNGAGKSTLLRLIGGSELPSRGQIRRHGRISWPLGLAAGFNGSMTGLENVQFLARIYGEDTERVVEFVEDFAELGASLRQPWGTYSSGMRARLAFAASMAIEFDTYLIDEVIAVGDASFKAKCQAAFRERRARARVIMVSHAMKIVRDYCEMGLVLHRGRLTLWNDVEDAIAVHQELIGFEGADDDED
jgi:capsular polysaccharide transport system ATP-binding protein